MRLDPVQTLQRLIQTPSVNPMGREPAGTELGEGRLTDLLVNICQQQGWRWSRRQIHPGRDNLLALIEGYPSPREGGELLVWDVHQDTVSADGMSIEPFSGELRDGRVYGRGACDVKGPMAAMLAALSRLSAGSQSAEGEDAVRREPHPTILLACTVNEECGFTGARALADVWSPAAAPVEWKESDFVAGELSREAFCPRQPDAAIVAEPTALSVVVAHQGVVRWRCRALGRAAHTSRPDDGVNAIYAMSRVVLAIERYHAELASTPPHPRCGPPSVCVSTICGGVGVNTVPDRATIEIDRRLRPDERPDEAYHQLVRFIAEQAEPGGCQIVHDAPFLESPALGDDRNGPLAKRLAEIVRSTGSPSELVGVPFGTDASAIAATGVPTVVFGPGSIAQAHTAEEFIDVGELERATDIFYRIARDGLC